MLVLPLVQVEYDPSTAGRIARSPHYDKQLFEFGSLKGALTGMQVVFRRPVEFRINLQSASASQRAQRELASAAYFAACGTGGRDG
jgi:hypothetical protein